MSMGILLSADLGQFHHNTVSEHCSLCKKKHTKKMVSLKLSLCSVVVCKVTLQNNEGGYKTVYAETHTKTL